MVPLPTDPRAVILAAVFDHADAGQHHPPTDRPIRTWRADQAIPTPELLAALAQIHQQPVSVIEEAFL